MPMSVSTCDTPELAISGPCSEKPLGRICLDKGRGFERKVRAGRPFIKTIWRGFDRVAEKGKLLHT